MKRNPNFLGNYCNSYHNNILIVNFKGICYSFCILNIENTWKLFNKWMNRNAKFLGIMAILITNNNILIYNFLDI